MRKMKKHRLFVLSCFVFLHLIPTAKAEDNFEDADTISDLMGASNGQQFDLRHTIPGIPEVDYPIYSAVPKTNFECTGRHEGYYADIESRCQAFRICTHTARSKQGFGFLCPNGTLFSQRYFVCDWYRNVNCDDSERYYEKNSANRIGSNLDMMETVRQMMEYPMKTITRALQQNTGSSQKPVQRQRGGNRGNLKVFSESNDQSITKNAGHTNAPRKSAVTRAQVESAQSRGSVKHGQAQQKKKDNDIDLKIKTEESLSQTKTSENLSEAIESKLESETIDLSESSSAVGSGNVYVNSLGELSTDPGIHFDRTNAHIIAEPSRSYRYEKNMNFAEKVNAALNDLADLPASESLAPDYVKNLRENSQDTAKIDLAFNVNSLLDEVANDLNSNTAGYQDKDSSNPKQPFRFLSRGFSNQNDPYKYKKPKQTASTVRFTPNELPNVEEKLSKKSSSSSTSSSLGNKVNEAKPFGSSTSSTTEMQPIVVDETTTLPVQDDFPDDNQYPVSEPLPLQEDEATTFPPTSTAEPEQELYTVTPETPTTFPNLEEVTASLALTATTTASTETPLNTNTNTNTEIPNTPPPNISENLVVTQQQQKSAVTQKFNEDAVTEPFDEDRLDVHKKAESLLISGIQLTNNENNSSATKNPLLIQVPEDHSYLTAWITSTPIPPTTDAYITTTNSPIEAHAESGSLQERIRNYRRLAGLQRATAKPLIYSKRAGLRMSTKTPSTTPKSTTTTQSYLKRVAASRLRLSRLAAAAASAASKSPSTTPASLQRVDNVLDTPNDKKLSVRNIDRETAISGQDNSLTEVNDPKITGIVTWESVRNSLQRFQTKRKISASYNKDNVAATTSSSASLAKPTTRDNSLARMRHRFGNLKTRNSENFESEAIPSKTSISTSVSQSAISSASSIDNHGSAPTSINFLNTNTQSPSIQPTPSQASSQSETQITFNTATSTFSSSTKLDQNVAAAENTNLNSNSAPASPQSSPIQSPPTFIDFDKLTRSIVDDSILQNYRAGQILGRSSLPSSSSSQLSATSFNPFQAASRIGKNQFIGSSVQQASSKLPATAPPLRLPGFPTTPGPRIVIARAEGQRIEPNSVSSIISSLITQQQKVQTKPTPSSSYVPLNDYLTKKFGNQPVPAATTSTFHFTQHQPHQQHQQQQQQQRSQFQHQGQSEQNQYEQQQQQQQQEIQQKQNYQQSGFAASIAQQYRRQQQPQQQQQFHHSSQQPRYQNQQTQPQQQQQQQSNFFQSAFLTSPQPTQQSSFLNQNQQKPLINPPKEFSQFTSNAPTLQPLNTKNIFADFQQNQQQLPQFPPLAIPQRQHQQQQQQQASSFSSSGGGINTNFLNVQLPSLTNGLIPAPNTPSAQRRSDIGGNFKFKLMDINPSQSNFPGATSYDVPLNSIGRLPNDMQGRLRRQRRI